MFVIRLKRFFRSNKSYILSHLHTYVLVKRLERLKLFQLNNMNERSNFNFKMYDHSSVIGHGNTDVIYRAFYAIILPDE